MMRRDLRIGAHSPCERGNAERRTAKRGGEERREEEKKSVGQRSSKKRNSQRLFDKEALVFLPSLFFLSFLAAELLLLFFVHLLCARAPEDGAFRKDEILAASPLERRLWETRREGTPPACFKGLVAAVETISHHLSCSPLSLLLSLFLSFLQTILSHSTPPPHTHRRWRKSSPSSSARSWSGLVSCLLRTEEEEEKAKKKFLKNENETNAIEFLPLLEKRRGRRRLP